MMRFLDAKHLFLGSAAFALTVIGIYAGGHLPFADASRGQIASSARCVPDRNDLADEVYFVSCGGFF